jgi:hypothetical protein
MIKLLQNVSAATLDSWQHFSNTRIVWRRSHFCQWLSIMAILSRVTRKSGKSSGTRTVEGSTDNQYHDKRAYISCQIGTSLSGMANLQFLSLTAYGKSRKRLKLRWHPNCLPQYVTFDNERSRYAFSRFLWDSILVDASSRCENGAEKFRKKKMVCLNGQSRSLDSNWASLQ